MVPKVLFTVNKTEREAPERIFDKAISILGDDCSVGLNQLPRDLTKEELKKRLQDKEGMFCLLVDKIDAEVMAAAPNLKVIANMAVGYDNIDVKAATERGIMVTNTPGILTETTADLAWSLLMAVARRIPEADQFTRRGKFHGWRPTMLLGRDVYGKILGIIGMGRIGQAMANRASGFDMVIYPYDTATSPDPKILERLLQESDFVTIHVPLTPETKHLIGEKELSLMKSTAYLINTSRGPVVDEEALVKALKEGKIAGAGLDVYEEEPKVHPELFKMKNVVLLPHIGSASIMTRTQMANMAATNLLAGLRGEIPPNLVNEEVLEKKN